MKRWLLAGVALLFWTSLSQAQTISSVIVSAPKVILTAGETIQLKTGAWTAQGNRVQSSLWTYLSSNTGVVSVDSTGLAKAVGVGVSNITVRTGSVTSPSVALQVLPLRIDVTPDIKQLLVGQTVQFKAIARDINEEPLPNANFAWSFTGATGFTNTSLGAIDSQGVFTPNGVGSFTIHAALTYAGQSAAELNRFEGVIHIDVKAPVDYKLTRWLASDPMEAAFALRPAYMSTEIGVNDVGQMAFIANLDGVAAALMLYDNGQFVTLATTGGPGLTPQSDIYHFEAPPSINNSGQVVVRYGGLGPWGLMLASKSGVTIFQENISLGSLERMNGFTVSRASLNDRGSVVFRANYTLRGARTSNSGLFRMVDGSLSLLWTNADPLPDLQQSYSFVDFGQDAAGNVTFTVQAGANTYLYRIASDTGTPEKLVGVGSNIAGVGSVTQLFSRIAISQNGNVAFGAVLGDGRSVVGRVRSGDGRLEARIHNNIGLILSINQSGEVFYTGDPGDNQWGMWRWLPGISGLTQVAPRGARYDSSFAFNWANSGVITSKGELFANIQSPDNSVAVVRPESGRVLFQPGVRISTRAPLTFQGLMPGASDGASVHVFAGSGNASVLSVTAFGATPVWIPGDRPTGLTSSVISTATKDPAGTLYLVIGDGVMRYQGNRFETLVRFPAQFNNPDGTIGTVNGPFGFYNGSNAIAANRNGALVWNANVGGLSRLMMYDRGVLSSLMALGGANPTNSPAGGKFSGLFGGAWHQNTVAIDNAGRVLVTAFTTGASGIFLYENGQWKTAAVFGTTFLGGDIVSGANAIVAGDNTFYALFNLTAGGQVIGEYDGQQWKVLVPRTDITPDGIAMGNLQSFLTANRRGDIAFITTNNRSRIVVRTADGKYHIVYTQFDVTASGDALWPFGFSSLELHDDRRLYIVGLDTNDRNTLYVADPLF
jgi:hypothetical protein